MTGVSSFTGSAIAHHLADSGHEVLGVLARDSDSYTGVRALRVAGLNGRIQVVDNCSVGSSRLTESILSWGVVNQFLIHHAEVGDYRSDAFDVPKAVSRSTAGCRELASLLAQQGCSSAVLTRSVFEGGQGLGEYPGPVSPYAIAKTASTELWRLCMSAVGVRCSDFTIANPVGPLEEPRFVSYLAERWLRGLTAVVRAPDHIRDNVPIDVLAHVYGTFARLAHTQPGLNTAPSFWISSNLDFARRVAAEFAVRSGRDCAIEVQSEGGPRWEPRIRVGVHEADPPPGWTVDGFWDRYAAHYGFLDDDRRQKISIPRSDD
ncbi:MAG: NAD-dependent epimerase/dehydratase family protein [Candidatus Nanopelagicales bacterium]